MTVNMSTYLADKLLDHANGKTSYTMPATYLALFTSEPTMPGGSGGTEVSDGSYVREELSGASAWDAASSGSATTGSNVTFPTATADWGTVTSIGILDASSSGNLLWAGPLTESKTVSDGDTFEVPAGDLTTALA